MNVKFIVSIDVYAMHSNWLKLFFFYLINYNFQFLTAVASSVSAILTDNIS